LAAAYLARRDLLVGALRGAGFDCTAPQGAYYVMADIRPFTSSSDVDFTRRLIRDVGVAVVPGSSFYSDPAAGSHAIRFCFCKREATLSAAAQRLSGLSKGRETSN
jgi:aminotransferase